MNTWQRAVWNPHTGKVELRDVAEYRPAESSEQLTRALDAAQDEIERLISEKEALRERLDWEQPEPEDDVIAVNDHTAPDNEQDGYVWGRTHRAGEYGPHSEWKGYKNGGKVYLDWPELVRRWGPLTVAARSGGGS